MGDIADEPEEPLAREHRRDDGDIGRVVLTGLVGVVHNERITWLDGLPEAATDLVHLRRQRPDVERLRDALRHHAARGIEDGEGEILAFLDDSGIARAQHVERELAGDLQGRLIDDFEIDGVHEPRPSRRVRPSVPYGFIGYILSSCAKYPSCFSASMMLRSR